MKTISLLIGLGVSAVLAGCSSSSEYTSKHKPALNRASTYCIQQGGELEPFSESHSRHMYCVFSKDEKHEQWSYYNNEKNRKR